MKPAPIHAEVQPDEATCRRDIDWEALAPTSWYARSGHRLLDACVLTAVFPVAVPLFAGIAAVNWCVFRDFRKILFVQARVGLRGRVFWIYKFRTMRCVDEGAMHSWSTGGDQARVTRFGRFLRSAHLDELPQIVNVLLGDMSIIGPRPEMLEIENWAAENIAGFSDRLVVRPGLTGYAQITQGYTSRDLDAYREKLEINRYYLRNITLLTHLEILLRTAWWVARGKGWAWRLQAAQAAEVQREARKSA